jgi:prepilin-type N-terminal cleavage/methylation domain-containing protein/prepilin-type processing-associated H-X9-DG protein
MRTHRAFTLVELLVVIGIITVLIAVLLPALSAARRLAYRMACASNMRQVGTALLMYAHENKGSFPLPAVWDRPRPEDWIHWQSSRDVKQSALWNQLGKGDRALKCPLGTMKTLTEYPYSYAVSVRITGWPPLSSPPFVPFYWPRTACKLTQVVQPTHKLLIGEMNPETIFDGTWFVDWSGRPQPGGNEGLPGATNQLLSVRHYADNELLRNAWTHIGFSNVVFVDGHYEFFDRHKKVDRYYYDPRYAGGPWTGP